MLQWYWFGCVYVMLIFDPELSSSPDSIDSDSDSYLLDARLYTPHSRGF